MSPAVPRPLLRDIIELLASSPHFNDLEEIWVTGDAEREASSAAARYDAQQQYRALVDDLAGDLLRKLALQ